MKSFPNILRQAISSSIKLLSKYHIRSIFLSDWTMNFSFEFDIDKCRNLMVILETACKLQTLCRTYSPVASLHGWMFINLFRDVMSLICKKMDMNFHAYTEIIFLVFFIGKLVLFFFMYYRFSWTISIVQAWSASKHMIISVVHTPPMPPPWMDYGNYPMFGNLYMIWSFDLPIFVVNYIQC